MHKKAKTGFENSNNNNASVLPKEATEPTDFQMRLKDMESRVKLLESELTNVKSAVTSLEKNQARTIMDSLVMFNFNLKNNNNFLAEYKKQMEKRNTSGWGRISS